MCMQNPALASLPIQMKGDVIGIEAAPAVCEQNPEWILLDEVVQDLDARFSKVFGDIHMNLLHEESQALAKPILLSPLH